MKWDKSYTIFTFELAATTRYICTFLPINHVEMPVSANVFTLFYLYTCNTLTWLWRCNLGSARDYYRYWTSEYGLPVGGWYAGDKNNTYSNMIGWEERILFH